MIKPNELRIGNLVYFKNKTVKVVDVCGHEITDVPHLGYRPIVSNPDITDYAVCKFFKPISITKELLLKFGFEKTGFNQFSKLVNHNQELIITQDFEYIYIVENYDARLPQRDMVVLWSKDRRGVIHVHKLQNLYFALTQTELEIIKE